MERLFVYGTLRPGHSNAHIMDNIGGEWQPGYVKGLFYERGLWGGDRLCMDGSSPRKQREALRDKAWGRTSRICTAGRKMRFFYDLCDEFCTILDC